MGFNKSLGQAVAVYSALIGLLYASFGFIEMLEGLGLTGGLLSRISELALVQGDIFAGAMLIITGIVHLAGISLVSRGDREGLSFITVGILLSTILFGLYVAIMGANGLGHVLGFEDWAEWAWIDDVSPGLWLWFPSIPGVLISLKKEWRE